MASVGCLLRKSRFLQDLTPFAPFSIPRIFRRGRLDPPCNEIDQFLTASSSSNCRRRLRAILSSIGTQNRSARALLWGLAAIIVAIAWYR